MYHCFETEIQIKWIKHFQLIHFDTEEEQIITCPICKTLTYRSPKGWDIIECHHSVISIFIADRQCEIITAKTNKLNSMTNIYVGWWALCNCEKKKISELSNKFSKQLNSKLLLQLSNNCTISSISKKNWKCNFHATVHGHWIYIIW